MNSRGEKSCRICEESLGKPVLSLGDQPLSNALLDVSEKINVPKYALDFKVCLNCGLGQIGEFASPSEIFQEYAYFSSTSQYWLNHAREFANMATQKFKLSKSDLVIELASNDGYLLQYFQQANVNVLGIEPATNVATYAREQGIPTLDIFFGLTTAIKLVEDHSNIRLVAANNVLAHVPDINDFMAGLRVLAEAGAVISIEAPSMLVMLRDNLFDTIYHEHFSYLSATAIDFLTQKHGLVLFDIETLPTHGGSYRFWIGLNQKKSKKVAETLSTEEKSGLKEPSVHKDFALRSKNAILDFRNWLDSRESTTVGYGAAAKATVFLNAASIPNNKIVMIADNSISKQSKMVPGVNIRIQSPKEVFELNPVNVVIFPWNIAPEIAKQIRSEFPNFDGEIWTTLPTMHRII